MAILELFDEWERAEGDPGPSANDALHDLRDRLHVPAMVGRVASRLVRHSRRSVLIVPQAGVIAHAMSAQNSCVGRLMR